MANCEPAEAMLVFGKETRQEVLSGAELLVISGAKSRSTATVRADEPLTFRAEGLPSDSWRHWFTQQVQATEKYVSDPNASSPWLAEATEILDTITAAGTYVGYVGGVSITVPFTIACPSGVAARGVLHTVDRPTTGLLDCRLTPPPGTLGDKARAYCPPR